MTVNDTPLLEVEGASKYFGHVVAIEDVSMSVRRGEVTCLLGDNGAGKSTLVKILCGAHKPSAGRYLVDGDVVDFDSPRDARERGIATVYQDLAMVPLMSAWRNFFLGSEPTKGWGPTRRIDVELCERVTREQLAEIGIELRDTSQPVGTLSGGERQALAIARAVYFGARVLLLDEPTAALGVKQASITLRYVARLREQGVAVVFVTHNPHHAYPVGDRFVVLRTGKVLGDWAKGEVPLERLELMMGGGEQPVTPSQTTQ